MPKIAEPINRKVSSEATEPFWTSSRHNFRHSEHTTSFKALRHEQMHQSIHAFNRRLFRRTFTHSMPSWHPIEELAALAMYG